MNLKSYLRGIGVGILVTSAVFMVSGAGKKSEMTDAQVIARAKELGLVESQLLSDISNVITPSQEQVEVEIEQVEEPKAETEEVTPDITDVVKDSESTEGSEANTEEVKEDTNETTEVKAEEVTPEVIKETEPEVTPEVTKEAEPEATPEVTKEAADKPSDETKPVSSTSTDNIVIVVNPGDGSDTVARRLYEAGIVENATEFDKYLMTNGYDRRITTGNHIISPNATDEEIGINLVSSTK